VLAGQHASRMRGRGLNFDEIRAYVPGDDTRAIDWKATLRSGRAQVRSYTEERDRPALLIVDQRLPMVYGSVRAMKSVIAAELVALAAWMVFRSGDRVGGIVFDDRRIEHFAPLRSRARIHAMFGAIARANAALRADDTTPVGYGQLDLALERAI